MKEIGFEELRSIQLDILKKVDEYCEQNNIQYSLAYGSLIGAVRHKGYIPWDDDIDIMMPRHDYNQFLSAFNGTYSHLRVISPEIVSSYYAPYANVYLTTTKLIEPHVNHGFKDLGVKIDIFPVDSVPSDVIEYERLFKRSSELCRWRSFKSTPIRNQNGTLSIRSIVKRIISFLIPFFYLNNELRKMQKEIDNNTEYLDIILWPIYKYKRFSHKFFRETIRVPFENIEVCIAKGYDGILTSIYGSYMELPPLENRVAKHDFIAYWKDK